jgi:hypothetical protein
MSEEVRTAEEIAQDYTAMGHSVELINGIIDGSKMVDESEEDKKDCVKRNVMANIYKNAGFNLTTTDLTTIYTVPALRTAIVKSIQISNEHSSNNLVEIFVTDSSASATFEIYHVSMDADSTANGLLAPLVLEAGDILKMQTANADKIEGMISYLEIFDEKST